MKKTICVIFIFLFFSCKKEQRNNQINTERPILKLEKIIVINLDETCLTYFKVKVTNKNKNSIIFVDNSLKDYDRKRLKSEKTGFYLKNIENDSVITLGIDNYKFYEVGGNRTGYLYMGATNLMNSFEQKDSLLLKTMLSNYVLEYNGKKLNLNNIKKNNYISQDAFNEFKNKKMEVIPLKDSISILIPVNIDIKYRESIPITKEDWNIL